MRVAVIGPAGFSGSPVCLELLNRGHDVVGISRNPGRLGKHERYTPLTLDIGLATIHEIADAFNGIDVLVNAYNPPAGPNLYKMFIETTRKIIIAVRTAKVGYTIMIGGTGSLEIPGEPYVTCADSREFWLAYRRGVADSEAATQHAQDRFGGAIAEGARAYRNARIALHAGKATDADHKAMQDVDDAVLHGENWIPDLPIAARAGFQMFEGNSSFNWTFVSPPGGFRPGPRTGTYEIYVDVVPLAKEAKVPSSDRNAYEGRILGVSAADLAVSIVDEAEKREKVGKHWTAVSEWPNDEAMPSYLTI
ncbi:hypothetical protein LTR37_009413 [Vermiconidia calcicola]|uniref:Uncharacterized protein n=1 Tax=Vermiconidia calcicola TaxID=1690605 RepID=A0ACC3N836_9PEZI|nr:hypothetical protein LTR37_009413 [Vermiconidia calcicola]